MRPPIVILPERASRGGVAVKILASLLEAVRTWPATDRAAFGSALRALRADPEKVGEALGKASHVGMGLRAVFDRRLAIIHVITRPTSGPDADFDKVVWVSSAGPYEREDDGTPRIRLAVDPEALRFDPRADWVLLPPP